MARKKVLIISVSGIGNTILQSPLIKALLNKPEFECDVLFGNSAMASIFQNEVRIVDQYILPQLLSKKFQLILQLRHKRYDYCVCCFPSNRFEFNVLPFLMGVKKRITHSYTVGKLRTLSFLSNCKIPANDKIHDVEQNLNLLTAFDITPANASRELVFNIDSVNEKFAVDFLNQHDFRNRRIAGIHAGSKRDGAYKRWPTAHFVTLIDRLNKDNIYCLLFSGPDEIDVTEQILFGVANKAMNFIVTEKNINNVGALIQKCSVFLNTDSGLGHIAPAVKVPTVTIIGPAQASRTAPYGEYGHYLSLNLECSPCLQYPFKATNSKIKCPYQFKCLTDLSVGKVYYKLIDVYLDKT